MVDPVVDVAARFSPDPDRPGWLHWHPTGQSPYGNVFSPMWVRVEDGRARCRIEPGPDMRNNRGDIHGGYLMGVVDQVLLIGSLATGQRKLPAVTLDVSSQFLAPGKVGEPLDAVVEVVHRTGQLIFVRGLLEQSDGAHRVLAFSGTLRELRVGAE